MISNANQIYNRLLETFKPALESMINDFEKSAEENYMKVGDTTWCATISVPSKNEQLIGLFLSEIEKVGWKINTYQFNSYTEELTLRIFN